MKNNKKAQTGLNLFLLVIVALFITGVLIMSFVLAMGQINSNDIAYDRTNTFTAVNQSNYMNGSIGFINIINASLRSPICSVSTINNGSVTIGSGNYTVSNCIVTQSTTTYENVTWFTTYTYSYLVPNDVYNVNNDTANALSSATDWFPIFITIAAIVVLILMVVLIVVSLRGAGLMGNNGAA